LAVDFLFLGPNDSRGKMNKNIGYTIFSIVLVMLGGCSATTSLSSAQPGATLEIKGSQNSQCPRSETLSTTTFGSYEFRAADKQGHQFFGVLPLQFNGGYLAMDIIIFNPGLFFNLREAYPFYEFDLERSLVKYKKHPHDPWMSYTPTPEEADQAEAYFFAK
jgi:hypothetical protein